MPNESATPIARMEKTALKLFLPEILVVPVICDICRSSCAHARFQLIRESAAGPPAAAAVAVHLSLARAPGFEEMAEFQT
jgi:hypothetical protein